MLNFIKFNQSVGILLQMIAQEYLYDSYCVTVITEDILSLKISNIPVSYINFTENTIFEENLLAAADMGCVDYMVYMENPERFILLMEQVNRLSNTRKSQKKVIISPINEMTQEAIKTFLSLKEVTYTANILLIVKNNDPNICEEYDLITHKFVGPNEDEVNQPLYLAKWNSCMEYFEETSSLFPHDISNLQGKTLALAAFTYEPYAILDVDKVVNPAGNDGTEVRIIQEFCTWVNCTIKIVSDDGYQWGEIHENGTGYGILGKVAEDKADFAVTALYSWFNSYKYLDFSASCIRTVITCLTPAPRILVSWELPLLPFGWVTWLILLMTLISATLALLLANKGNADGVFLMTFAMMIAQSQPESKKVRWRVRSITAWMLVTGLVLDNAYGAGLAATFTVPKYEKSVETIQDMIDAGMIWLATDDAWIFSMQMSQERKIMQLVSQFRTHSAEVLKQKSFTKQVAFSIEKLPAGYFAIGDYITKEAVLEMKLMEEDFYYEQTVVMSRKSSAYIDKLNTLIGRLHDSGLLLAWESQIALQYLDNKVQQEVKLSRSKKEADVTALTTSHVVGIFIIYCFGTAISVMIFLAEVLLARLYHINE